MPEDTRVLYVCSPDARGDISDFSVGVETVHSPARLSDALRTNDPDVVVCEYRLDGRETGLDVLSRLRRTEPELPVILCTAEPDGEIASAATRLGVTEYVPHDSDGGTSLADRVRPYLSVADPAPVADGNPGSQVAGGMPGDPTVDTTGTSDRERELERVNRRLDLALESMDAGVFVWDSNTDEIRWDEATSELFGLEPRRRTLSRDSFFGSIHPDDRQRVQTAMQESLEGTGECEIEYRTTVSGGETRWLATDAEVVWDRSGAPERMVGVTRDVTDRRSMAERLRKSQDALQRLYEITSSTDLEFDEKLRRLLDLGRKRLDLQLGYLNTVDGDRIEVVEAVGLDWLEGQETHLSNVYCRRTVESDDLVTIRDSTQGEWADSTPTELFDVECYLGGRVEVDGELYGTLCFADNSPRARPFSEVEETFVELVVEWLSFELERQDREQEIRNARQRAENILERIDDGFFAVDDDWEITFFNSEAEDILGMSADDAVGENLWDQFPEAVERAFYDEYHEAMESQTQTSFQEYFPPLDTWFSVSVYPSQDGLSVYFEDITERKHREQDLERYETIMETIDDGVYALDDEGRFTFANEALADLTGHSVTDLLGRHVSIVKGEQTVKLGEEVLGRMLSEGIEKTTFEFDLEHADGREVPFEDKMTVLPFEDGEFTGTAGVFRDISKHKRRETMLTSLMETTRELMQAPTKEAVADIVAESARSILGFDLNLVRLYDPERGVLEPTAGTEGVFEILGDRPLYEPGEGVPGEVFATGESLFYSDRDDPAVDIDPVDEILCVPLGDHGTLSLSARALYEFDEVDQQVAEILGMNAREALDRAEREEELTRYETIMETVQHMVYVLDDEGRFTLVTTPFAERLGCDRTDLLGEPADQYLVSGESGNFRDAIADLRANPALSSQTIETDITTAGDEQFPAAVDVSLLPGEQFTGTVGVVQDLTELEQTREELRDERDRFSYLFDNIPDAVVDTRVVDGDPVVESTNPAFADVFGYDPEDVLGEPIDEYVLPEDGDPGVKRFDEQVSTGDVEQMEVRRRTADGVRHFLFRGIPYAIDDTGTRAFGIYTDITEQKHRQRQLEVLNRVLRHNIRNDLTVVLGHADQLQYELDDPAILSMVETLTEKAENIVQMSEKVRDIERTIDRSVTGRSQNLRSVVASAVVDCREQFPHAEFDVEVPSVEVQADEQLETAVYNLVENAIEHNDSETPRVDIAAMTATDDDETTIDLRIVDNGPGIPENERAVIAGDQSITQLNHASGLGLWLVRWILDAYGGDLSFDESRDDGAAVSLSLRKYDSGE